MNHWLLRRITFNVLVLFAALIINFAISRMMPGDPVNVYAGGVKLTPEARQAQIERFGLDAPVWTQFWRYFTNTLQGDLGVSFYYFPKSVWHVMLEALPWTLLVVISSLLLQVTLGYFLGVMGAWRAGGKWDSFLQTFSLAIFSAPMFWIAMILLYIFGYQIGWFPLNGAMTPAAFYEGFWDPILDILRHAAMPIMAMTVAQYAAYQLILRNTMVGVLKEQYILTAEAKGLSPRRIKHRHAARNALLPMLTFLAVSFAFSIGGSVYIETVFSYPGVGKLIFDSVMSRDYPLMLGCFFLFTLVVIAANFAIDIIYRWLDPRIRF